MRTTLTIDDGTYRQAKAYAAEHGVSIGSVVEDALRLLLSPAGAPEAEWEPLISFPGTLKPGFDASRTSDLLHELDIEDAGHAVR